MSDAAAAQRRDSLDHRRALDTMRARRRRVWRGAGFVLLSTVGLIVLLMLARDRQAFRESYQRTSFVAEALQKCEDEGRPPPLEVPIPPLRVAATEEAERSAQLRAQLYYDPYFEARVAYTADSSAIGVCCDAHQLALLLYPGGRHVVLYDAQNRRYRVAWYDETEFVRQAYNLGLQPAIQ